MKKSTKKASRRRPKRDLFGELQEGFAALADARQGKRTLRTHSVELRPVLDVSPSELIQLRDGYALRIDWRELTEATQ